MSDAFRKLRLMVGRAVLNLVNDAAGLQTLQVTALEGETRDGVERLQQFGLTSVPLGGCDAIVLSVAGSRDHMVAVAVDDPQRRPAGLAGGETALYNAHNVKLHLTQDGHAVLTCKRFLVLAEEEVVHDAPVTRVTGELIVGKKITGTGGMALSGGDGARVTGGMKVDGDVRAHDVSLLEHIHNGDSGGQTSKPL